MRLKAVGNYVIIKTEENITESGIKVKHDNMGLVISSPKFDKSLEGCRVIYNDDTIYKKHGIYLFVPYEKVFAIVEESE
jgi:hypothetical protein